MSVDTSKSYEALFTGTGITGPFEFTFPAWDDADVEVIRGDANGVETVLILDVDYEMSLAAGVGGEVNLVVALPTDEYLMIRSIRDYTQDQEYTETEKITAQSLNDALDKLAIHIQQVKEITERTPHFRRTCDPDIRDLVWSDPYPNYLIGWDSAGTAIQNYPTTSLSVPVFDWIGNYTDLADMVATIGAGSKTVVIDTAQAPSANVTIPNNIHLFFVQGGAINPAVGTTTTINNMWAPPGAQVFGGLGTIAFASTTTMKEAHTNWWGTTAAAINLAIVACAARNIPLYLPQGVITTDATIDFKTGMILRGAGGQYVDATQGTIITPTVAVTTAVRALLCYNVEFDNIHINMANMAANAIGYAHMGSWFVTGSRCSVTNYPTDGIGFLMRATGTGESGTLRGNFWNRYTDWDLDGDPVAKAGTAFKIDREASSTQTTTSTIFMNFRNDNATIGYNLERTGSGIIFIDCGAEAMTGAGIYLGTNSQAIKWDGGEIASCKGWGVDMTGTTWNRAIFRGTTFNANRFSITDTGVNWTWTNHAGNVFKLDQALTVPAPQVEAPPPPYTQVFENDVGLRGFATAAEVVAAGTWAYENGVFYIWTTGSVDPDTLASGTIKIVGDINFNAATLGYVHWEREGRNIPGLFAQNQQLTRTVSILPDITVNNKVLVTHGTATDQVWDWSGYNAGTNTFKHLRFIKADQTLTNAAAVAIDLSLGTECYLAITDATAPTIGAPSNAYVYQEFTLCVKNTHVAGVVVSFNAVFAFSAAAGPPYTIAAARWRSWQFKNFGSKWACMSDSGDLA
ncbi:hypothetical protein [Candidatus Magnetobacterium casense]|uniref:Uncharacterized protein n=1 Tax=Candidatus Magnetobacterium casense TaxID=1455061 RepID=A0ABS6RZB1_9BACT|nr:hypothetical protein [Candidatus Magnetobacterium casensis]MBV6341752.1 hypothetical protein [Candidatus Magnetobacterium casensis]